MFWKRSKNGQVNAGSAATECSVSGTLPEIISTDDVPPRGGEISVSVIDSRRGGYQVLTDNPRSQEEIAELNRTYTRNQTAVSVRLASHLLGLEAAELDKDTSFDIEGLHQGIANRTYKIAIAMAGSCMKGVALAEQSEGDYSLTHWYVVDRQRGKGVGRALLHELGVPVPKLPQLLHQETALPLPDLTPSVGTEAVA